MFFEGPITAAMQRSEQLSWPLLLFVATPEQVNACRVMIEEGQFESLAVLQLIVTGTVNHTQFQTLVADTDTPRVHLFAPKRCRAALPPMALSGEHFTAQRIGEAIHLASEWNEAYVQELIRQVGDQTESSDVETTRYRKMTEYQKMKAPLFGKGPAAVAPPAPAPASDAAASLFVELLTHTSTVVFKPQDASTSLAVVWDAAVAKANANEQLSGLQLRAPESRMIVSKADSSKVLMSSLPAGTRITAVFMPLKVVPSPTAPVVATSEQTTIVCDGDQCRRVPVAPTTSPADVPAAAPTAESVGVSVRCQKPDGSSFIVRDLQPESLLDVVRQGIVEHLGTEDFAVYNSYPPKRFQPEDFQRSLKELGLARNAAVRIVMSTSLATPPSTVIAASTPSSGIISSSVNRLTGMLRGLTGAGGAAVGPAPTSEPTANERPASSSASRPRFATLASMAQNDEDEEAKRNKSNRYYGGSSTEFEGKGN